ncbi:MAG: lysophospholipid acyltransferase family protein [Sneathiella sp.]
MPEESNAPASLKYRIELCVVKFAFWFFKRLGRRRAARFGSWLARKVGPRLSVQKVADRNMQRSLPELSETDRRQALERMWDNLGRNIAELPFNADLDFNADDVELVGRDILDNEFGNGKPAFFLTGHYGPWELIAHVGDYLNCPTTIVYRAANNPLVDQYFQRERSSKGYSFVPKGVRGARGILKAIKKGEIITLLNDQKQNTGLPIPFFGRDAMTAPNIAELACKYELPIYPIRAERLENGKIRVTVSEAITPPSTGDRKQDIFDLLVRINEVYEEWIRARPDHWFWVHNRWPE